VGSGWGAGSGAGVACWRGPALWPCCWLISSSFNRLTTESEILMTPSASSLTTVKLRPVDWEAPISGVNHKAETLLL